MDAPDVSRERLEIQIRGAVQGVGFRPFVYRCAIELGLAGYVLNTPEGVDIAVEGPRAQLDRFLQRVQGQPPPLSIIERVETCLCAATGLDRFDIRPSDAAGRPSALVLPDIATCADCLREINDPNDRRYRYPFTNCTHCGPRFSIIARLPYDRPNTSMAAFALCDACRIEYEDPRNRRFHAQPTACPACGPHLELWMPDGACIADRDAALFATAAALRDGKVAAVKGLGGFHLMADARDAHAVARLRARKHREEKPFALLYPDMDRIMGDCHVSDIERQLLESPECPIVLLYRRSGDSLAEGVAPGAPRYGVMLPCTPLHHLLMRELGFPVVATSGNLSEEPICIDEREALERLQGIADVYLVHNRPIVRHVDDSIVHVVLGREMVLRRARGYAPLPVRVAPEGPPLIAFGGHLKNTVAVAKDGQVFLSQHIGDLETTRAFDAFREATDALQRLYDVTPARVACDQHPDYISTRHARELGLPVTAVQHHYAHVLACMAEHGLEGPVLGVSWDGTGFGPDGAVWGGEFLHATRTGFRRIAHLRPFPLPGGDTAVREPRRSAFGLLYALYGAKLTAANHLPPLCAFTPEEVRTLARVIAQRINTPETSSAGRLFDAVASLLGLHQRCTYEGQAAMALEFAARRAADSADRGWGMDVVPTADGLLLDWGPVIKRLLAEADAGGIWQQVKMNDARPENPDIVRGRDAHDHDLPRTENIEALAAAFHHALARGILCIAQRAPVPDVVLTGGCFQNVLLTELTAALLQQTGFTVHCHRRIPPNDGGIALGQAAHALALYHE